MVCFPQLTADRGIGYTLHYSTQLKGVVCMGPVPLYWPLSRTQTTRSDGIKLLKFKETKTFYGVIASHVFIKIKHYEPHFHQFIQYNGKKKIFKIWQKWISNLAKLINSNWGKCFLGHTDDITYECRISTPNSMDHVHIVCVFARLQCNAHPSTSHTTLTDLPCRPVGSIVIVCKKKKEQIECQELPEDSDLMLVILVYGQH